MTLMDSKRLFVPAWGISFILHGVVVGVAFMLTTQVKPILQEEVFQWDVALVEAAKPESVSNQAQSVVTPVQPPAKVVPQPRQKPVEQEMEPLQPTIESVSPIEQKVEMPEVRKEPVEQHLVEVAEPTPEPMVEQNEAELTEVQPVQPESVAAVTAPASLSEVSVAQQTPELAASPDVPVNTASIQEARATVPGPEIKLDYRWLAESLWRRVAELKRYPNTSRMNGEEGKVILKAVIRSNGQLATVSVQKSSGYSALDQAAMEAVRLACPLHMKHAIGKPHIVVTLPIVYRLAG